MIWCSGTRLAQTCNMRTSHITMTVFALSVGSTAQVVADTGSLSNVATRAASTSPTISSAQSPATLMSTAPRYAFGMRVGGYGFRQSEGDRRNGWEDCRMNGIGAFGEYTISKHAFVEAGADLYFSETFPMAPTEEPVMDRMSGLFSLAGGLRMFPRKRVSSYVQLGVGLELTKVGMVAEGVSDNFALPVGFVGIGGDVKLTSRLRIGANLRAYVMGHFPHSHEDSHEHGPIAKHDDGVLPVAEPTELSPVPEAAAQAQFYLRYSL